MPETSARRLAGAVALVTGAAGGIGLATARRLAGEECRVLLNDIDAERLAAAAAALDGGEIASEVADIADPNACRRLVAAAVERWGRIDILVNNAAYHGPRAPFLELADAEWERIFATNVLAAARLARAAAANMLPRGSGAIINVGSIQAEMPLPTYSAYVASKGAVAALTRALAVELSPSGIRVNAVLPGVIATESARATVADARVKAPATFEPNAALLRRTGRAEEAAAVIAFLASQEASFITGATLAVDGGRSISRLPDPFDAKLRGYSIEVSR